MEGRLSSGGGEWLMEQRYRTLNRVPEKAIPAKTKERHQRESVWASLRETDYSLIGVGKVPAATVVAQTQHPLSHRRFQCFNLKHFLTALPSGVCIQSHFGFGSFIPHMHRNSRC